MYGGRRNNSLTLTKRSANDHVKVDNYLKNNHNDYDKSNRNNNYAKNSHDDYDKSNRDDYSQSERERERESKSVKSRSQKSELLFKDDLLKDNSFFRTGTPRKKQAYDDFDESIDEILIEKQKTAELARELSNLRTNYDELKQKYNDSLIINTQQKEEISLLEVAIRTIDRLKQENETLRYNIETRLINLENKSNVQKIEETQETQGTQETQETQDIKEIKETNETKEAPIMEIKNVKEIPRPKLALPIIINNK